MSEKSDEELQKALDMAMSRVPGDDNLWVSGLFALRRPQAMKEAGITHVVSALNYDFKSFRGWEAYTHLNVPLDDVEDENMMENFPTTNKFIGDALASGHGVLVHCAMGKSRSVTCIIAYLLSTRQELNPDSALALVRTVRPVAEPNEGFMEQLRLYYSLGCPEDLESQPAYQRWVYKREVELSTAIGRAPDRLRFEDEEKKVVEASGVLTEGISELKPEEQKTLRCRKCRGILASSEYFEPHVPKEEAEVDPYAPISTSDTLPAPNPDAAPREAIGSDRCGHYFIQPLSWMRPALETGELEGRLNCPNARCGAAVGRFNWKGLKCSCGAWEIPAFAIQKGRVDVLGGARVLGDAGRRAAGVRLPPGMRMPPGRSENL